MKKLLIIMLCLSARMQAMEMQKTQAVWDKIQEDRAQVARIHAQAVSPESIAKEESASSVEEAEKKRFAESIKAETRAKAREIVYDPAKFTNEQIDATFQKLLVVYKELREFDDRALIHGLLEIRTHRAAVAMDPEIKPTPVFALGYPLSQQPQKAGQSSGLPIPITPERFEYFSHVPLPQRGKELPKPIHYEIEDWK